LTLTSSVQAEQAGPYLLGVYEREIHPAWDLVLRSTYPQIVDIGAKFGYYAVGLARKYPGAPVVAFDTDWWARRALREVARENGCTNVTVRGFCTRDWLAANLEPGALVVSDCEGYEVELMLPRPVEAMRSATIVVESHDHAAPGTSERLRAAFAQTHEVSTFASEVTRLAPPVLDFLPPEERSLASLEVRSTTAWLLCIPRERRS
jgi:precorrin-6B methylase 2